MLFLADPIEVDEAHRIGLINRKTARGEALGESLRIAETIAQRAPLSLATMKKAVYGGLSMPLGEAIEWEFALGASLSGSRDRKEGIAAFAEKRKPRFTGE
jgi:enoyl-CoA hydratase/carnithine racemase